MNLIRHENYGRLWKMRNIFHKLNDVYAKYYSPTEHLAVDEINMLPFLKNIYQKNTNGLGYKSTSCVIHTDTHKIYQYI
jgi:hypothetical protein